MPYGLSIRSYEYWQRVLDVTTGYLTEEYILRGAQAFDRQRERQSANRRAAKELLA